MDKLPDAIRNAASSQGLTIEAFRKKSGLSNGRFYEILSGEPPKKLDAIEKLKAAGVVMPGAEPAKAKRGKARGRKAA